MEGRIVVLAGGVSSRMKKPQASQISDVDGELINEANSKPKSMLGLGQDHRPFLDYLLYNIQNAGYIDVVLVINEMDSQIKEYYSLTEESKTYGKLRLSYAVQKIPVGRTKPLGTADAVYQAMLRRPDWSGGKFTVCNSDNLYSVNALSTLLRSKYSNTMIDYDFEGLNYDAERISSFAITEKDAEGFLTDIVEKPDTRKIVAIKEKSGFIGVSMNLWRFDYDQFFPFAENVPLNPVRNEKEIPSAIRNMIAKYPTALFAHRISEEVIDLTSKGDLAHVQKYLAQNFGMIHFDKRSD